MRKQIVATSEENTRHTPKAEAETIAPAINEESLLQDAKTVMVYRRSESGTMKDNEFLTRLNYPLAEGLLIEEIIQQLHGAGHYRIEYRDRQGRMIHANGDLAIGEPPKTKDNPAQVDTLQAASTLTPQQITAAVISGLQQARPPEQKEPSLDHLLQTAKLLKELNGTPTPQRSLVEQIKELREVERLITPKSEPIKTQEPPEPDPTAAVLKMLTKNPETAKTIQTQLASLFTGESPI